MNYRQIIARQKGAESRVIRHFGDPTTQSGVYVFHRYNGERETDCYYIGQAINLKRRIAQHLLEYDHLALSLKKYGLFCKNKNPKGWHIEWTYATKEVLDTVESSIIDECKKREHTEVYNITSGGQGKGKTDINQRAERKGYYSGKNEGKAQAYKEIGELIEKYTNGLTSKKGKIAERKTAELLEKLKGG